MPLSSKGRLWLAVLVVLMIQHAAGVPPPYPFTVRYKGQNLDAPLLILDYGSLSVNGAVANEDRCEAACRTIVGCNAYVYCNDPNGCGSGCAAYVKANPTLSPPPSGQLTYKSQALPTKSFGSYAKGDGCHAVNKDKWAKGFCSLKTTSTPTTPKFFAKDGSDWSSGVITAHQPWTDKCKGVPWDLCVMCTNYWDLFGSVDVYNQCLDCAKGVTAAAGTVNSLAKATAAWSCQWCLMKQPGDRSVDRKQCFNCVKKLGYNQLYQLCPAI